MHGMGLDGMGCCEGGGGGLGGKVVWGWMGWVGVVVSWDGVLGWRVGGWGGGIVWCGVAC